MKEFTIKTLAETCNVHTETLFKIKRGVSKSSAKLAVKLEEATGVDRLKWLYPDEYGNPLLEIV